MFGFTAEQQVFCDNLFVLSLSLQGSLELFRPPMEPQMKAFSDSQ